MRIDPRDLGDHAFDLDDRLAVEDRGGVVRVRGCCEQQKSDQSAEGFHERSIVRTAAVHAVLEERGVPVVFARRA